MAVETKVGGLLLNGSFEQGSTTNAYNWLQEDYHPSYDAYARRESVGTPPSGSYYLFTYSVGTDGWARGTSDAFTLRAKQLIYYYKQVYDNPFTAKFQLLDAEDSLLTEDAFTGSAVGWTKRTLDVSAYIGQSVKVRVWSTTTSHGNGTKVCWDFIREDIPSWVHKCVVDLGTAKQLITDSLAFTDAIVKKTKRKLTDALAFTDAISYREIIKKALTDALAFSDTLIKKTKKSLSDNLAFTDVVKKKTKRVLSDTITFTDVIKKKVKRTFSDSLAFTDAIKKKTKRVLTDNLAFTDALTYYKKFIKLLTDAIAFTDTLHKKTSRKLTDTLSFTDVLYKKTRRILRDTISFTDRLKSWWRSRFFTDTSTRGGGPTDTSTKETKPSDDSDREDAPY